MSVDLTRVTVYDATATAPRIIKVLVPGVPGPPVIVVTDLGDGTFTISGSTGLTDNGDGTFTIS